MNGALCCTDVASIFFCAIEISECKTGKQLIPAVEVGIFCLAFVILRSISKIDSARQYVAIRMSEKAQCVDNLLSRNVQYVIHPQTHASQFEFQLQSRALKSRVVAAAIRRGKAVQVFFAAAPPCDLGQSSLYAPTQAE